MKHNINIVGNNRTFKYVVEYDKGNSKTHGNIIKWYKNTDTDTIRLYSNNVQYYRDKNDWYSIDIQKDEKYVDTDISTNDINISTVRVYVPNHSPSTYMGGIKYMLTLNTWIGNYKIDLGSYFFKPSDTHAIPTGVVRVGNIEYYECIEFDIIDPYYLFYSDDWDKFRKNICGEAIYTNGIGSSLHAVLHIVEEYDDRYMFNTDYVSGTTSFVIANASDGDYLNVKLKTSNDPLGFIFETHINKQYNDLIDYFGETYNIANNGAESITANDINYQLVLRSEDSIIVGPKINIGNTTGEYGKITKLIKWSDLPSVDDNDSTKLFKTFFQNWNAFDEGWIILGALIVTYEEEEVVSFVSNMIPVTQDVFAMYSSNSVEHIDTNNINIPNYEVVHKNKIIEFEIDHPILKADLTSSDAEKIIFRHNSQRTLKSYKTVLQQVICNKYN